MSEKAIQGCLLGTAIGDALGLPYEGLSPARASRILGAPTRHRLFFGRGMVSDDTEHTCMVAQALIESGNDPEVFCHNLARRLRSWLLCVPAGAGFATLRAILKLWCGVPPERSGVFSAGNGAAMRAAILGVAIEDRKSLWAFVQASTRLTHTDPKAEAGTFAIALAARMATAQTSVESEDYLSALETELGEGAKELTNLLRKVVESVHREQSTQEFASESDMGKGVSGYVYETVPVAIHAWLSFPNDFRRAVESVILCGGDTDTTAAIVGGIVGVSVGVDGIPLEWRNGLAEWQRTPVWLTRLGTQLSRVGATGQREKPITLSVLLTLARNVWFLLVILLHGFRRLIPF